jgi:hypothetical protein
MKNEQLPQQVIMSVSIALGYLNKASVFSKLLYLHVEARKFENISTAI